MVSGAGLTGVFSGLDFMSCVLFLASSLVVGVNGRELCESSENSYACLVCSS